MRDFLIHLRLFVIRSEIEALERRAAIARAIKADAEREAT